MTNANSVCDDLILMTQDYWTWVGGSNFCWKWLPWWHVKIRWWVLQIRRNWRLRNIDLFPYLFSSLAFFFLKRKKKFAKTKKKKCYSPKTGISVKCVPLLSQQTHKENKTFFVRLGIENKEKKKTLQYPKNKVDTESQKSWEKIVVSRECHFWAHKMMPLEFSQLHLA